MNHPPIENRGGSGSGPFVGLARKTGLSEEFLADLARRGELRNVVEALPDNRNLDPRARLPRLEAKKAPEPPKPKSSRHALLEILDRRWPDWKGQP